MKTKVAATSVATYHAEDFKKRSAKQRTKIISYLKRRKKPVTARQISVGTGIELSSVAGRLNEMRGVGVKRTRETMKCPISKRSVYGHYYSGE